MKNILTLALAAVTTLTTATPALAGLAGEFQAQENYQDPRVEACTRLHQKAPYQATWDYWGHNIAQQTRYFVSDYGMLTKVRVWDNYGPACDVTPLAPLNTISHEGRDQVEYVKEGNKLVRYHKTESNNIFRKEVATYRF
jgi:hypothetical protein